MGDGLGRRSWEKGIGMRRLQATGGRLKTVSGFYLKAKALTVWYVPCLLDGGVRVCGEGVVRADRSQSGTARSLIT